MSIFSPIGSSKGQHELELKDEIHEPDNVTKSLSSPPSTLPYLPSPPISSPSSPSSICSLKQSPRPVLTNADRTHQKQKTKLGNPVKRHVEEIEIDPVFYGNVPMDCPSTAKVVRIFTSSTFTDTKQERNWLMEKSYPKIKSFCQDRGYEFQVVDMRWGVRDEATDDHMGTDLCLRELEKCQKISTGPNFVSLLSHKYGYRSLLREVDAAEFEKILDVVDTKTDKELLMKWFQRDDNAVPPVYVLKSVSKNIPDFLSKDREKKMAAKNIWWEDGERMQMTLATKAEKLFGRQRARKYFVSVTEKEVEKGLLENKRTETTCLWIKRNIIDINEQTPCGQLSRYKECLGPEEKWREAQELLSDLRDKRMIEALPPNRILAYDVSWTDKGIDPDYEQHKEYLDKMSTDFENIMYNMIDEAIVLRNKSYKNDPLYEECVQHISFCQDKCQNFRGREETLKEIKDYILGSSNAPLVVHGSSGSGKTSIMSMVAKQSWSWLNGNAVIILRFIGTTPASSNIIDFLSSILNQLQKIYGLESSTSNDLMTLSRDLVQCLDLAKEQQKIILIIDSLDQFCPTHGVRQLKWLPTELPNNVKIIVSTLEDQQYECFQKLQNILQSEECFIKIPIIPTEDVNNILSHWLSKSGRCVTSGQRKIILQSFSKCPSPLFLKLSFDQACRWNSYMDPDETILQTTVRESINSLFSRVEVLHGKIFVSRTLGYLTASKNGLSTAELEDILSCDDDVLKDLYMYWTPPSRRLPPLLLVRLKSDLEQYFVERGSDGVRTFYWYHRQFTEAAQVRYCGKEAETLHTSLADFFSGVWANGKKKPFTDKAGMEQEADRFVASQPIRFGNSYNQRKLNNLPHHRILSTINLELLKKECLCNFEFLQAKLISCGVRQVIEDFSLANVTFNSKSGTEDKELELLEGAFQLSQQALIYDPYQLAPQMLCRLSSETILEDFLQQCENCRTPYMVPDINILTTPGGQLCKILPNHTSTMRYLDLSSDGKRAVTSSDDETVIIWDLHAGRDIKTIEDLENKPQKVLFASCDEKILVQLEKKLLAIEYPSWEPCFSISSEIIDVMFCVTGKNKSFIAVFHGKSCILHNATDGKILETVKHSKQILFDGKHGNGEMYGSENFVVVSNSTQDSITVLDLKLKSFGPIRKAFKKDENGFYLTVDGLVITKDERYIICSNYMDNNLQFFDIKTLSITKICKGIENDFSQDFQLTEDGKYLYFPSNMHLVVWNLESLERSVHLEHTQHVTCTRTNDMETVVTLSDDNAVRVWDMTISSESPSATAPSLGYKILKVETFPNCRYVLCHTELQEANFKTHEKAVHCFQVYDVKTKSVVRQTVFMKSPPSIHHVIDDKTIAIVTKSSRKLKLIDVETMSIKRVFEGKTHKRQDDFVILHDGAEIAVPSRGRMFVKIYDTENGRTKILLKGGQKERIDNLKVNSKSTILLVRTDDEGPYMIFNLKTAQCIRTLYKKDFLVSELCYGEMISSSGGHIGILASVNITLPVTSEPDDELESNAEETIVCVWNVETDCATRHLIDDLYVMKYNSSTQNRNNLSAAVCDVVNLDDTHILTSHDDYILRIWDIQSGQLVKRLSGHTTGVKIYAIDGSPYFVTYGQWGEEDALRLWDRKTFDCLTSFKMDKSVENVTWCKDGKSFIATSGTSKVLYWKVYNTNWSTDLANFALLFKDQKCDLTITLENEEDNLNDPDDPDTDEEEPEPEMSDDENDIESMGISEDIIESDEDFIYDDDITI